MIDEDGEEWLPAAQVAERLQVPRYLIDSWVSRGKVRQHRVGGASWVNYPDAAAREHAWRTRTTRGSAT